LQSAVRSLLVAALAALCACAPKALVLPTGASTPFPEFGTAYQQATAACGGVKTLSVSMGMSGKAGPTKLRGRIDAGFASPGRARLEGRHPVFGKPVFILVADGGRGTVVLPREDRVLRDASPERIVEALAGVPLGGDALRTVISGCGFGVESPSDGRTFANGWAAGSSGGAITYLRRSGDAWELAAATLGGITVTYADYASGRPATVRIRAGSNASTADITLRLSDVDINTTLDPRTFEVELPDRPIPLTLEELRRAGPLGGS
jgi:outer membrane lipoprotein-sorting protein